MTSFPSRQNRTAPHSRRRGVATLEFVMALPLLVVLFYAGFMVWGAFSQKLDVVQSSRYTAFHELPDTQPTEILRLEAPPDDGLSLAEFTRDINLYGDPQSEVTAGGRTAALGGTWDAATVPFPRDQPPLVPHVDVARLFGVDLGSMSAISQPLTTLSRGLNFARQPSIQSAAEGAESLQAIVDVQRESLETVVGPLKEGVTTTRNWLSDADPEVEAELIDVAEHGLDLLGLGLVAIPELIRAVSGEEVDWEDD